MSLYEEKFLICIYKIKKDNCYENEFNHYMF